MASKEISLICETETLRFAVSSARILTDFLRHHGFSDDHEERQAVHSISSVLSLVECRLSLLQGAISGAQDPALLLAHHNAVSGVIDDDDVLLGWTAARRLERAERELRRAERLLREDVPTDSDVNDSDEETGTNGP